MYDAFFDLQENPFCLSPNPKFFFWNKVHSDAMKYLIYGIKNQEGFIEILGEAGTGKTLLCLMLLDQLGENAHSVLFLNPPESEDELLLTIIDTLKLEPGTKDRKGMIKAITEFSKEESIRQHNIIFLFDEAQHLSSDILEKIRLLTNAPQISRPIQVILIGQPELEKKLCSYDLRQLYQRITIRFQLKPLSRQEMPDYINFRLKLAKSSRNISFSRRAMNLVFQFSKGNPRLVNVICEKAILAASLDQTARITPNLIKAALRSTLDIHKPFSIPQPVSRVPRRWAFASLALVGLLLSGFLWQFRAETGITVREGTSFASSKIMESLNSSVEAFFDKKQAKNTPLPSSSTPPVPVETPRAFESEPASNKKDARLASRTNTPVAGEKDEGVQMLDSSPVFDENGIMRIGDKSNYNLASLVTMLNYWKIKGIDGNRIEKWKKIKPRDFSFKDISLQCGLEASYLRTSLNEFRGFNVPAILLNFYDAALERECSVVLTRLDKNQAEILHPGRGKIIVEIDELDVSWGGRAIVMWRNVDNLPSYIISPFDNDKTVLRRIWRRLQMYGYVEGLFPDDPDVAELSLKNAVVTFQKENGLKPDGLIGTRTKLLLYADRVKEKHLHSFNVAEIRN